MLTHCFQTGYSASDDGVYSASINISIVGCWTKGIFETGSDDEDVLIELGWLRGVIPISKVADKIVHLGYET